MQISVETILQVLAVAGVPVGVYAAVRADLASLKVRIERAEKDIQTIFHLRTKP
jgi:hypothetical protein